MTIPIKPGPFSFLAELGRAGGEAFAAAERDRQKKIQEAQQRLNQAVTLRAAGIMPPEAFGSPEMMQLYQTLGIPAISTQPTSQEMTESTRREFLQPDKPEQDFGLMNVMFPQAGQPAGGAPKQRVTGRQRGPGSISDEQRIVAGLPTRSQLTQERVAGMKAGRQEEVLTSPQTSELVKNTVAGVPDPLTLQAEHEAARDQLFNSQAVRMVEATITQMGGDILTVMATPGGLEMATQQAWLLAQQDAKSRGYVADEQLTKPYIQSALMSSIRMAQKIAIDRMAAANRGLSGQDTTKDYLQILVALQGRAVAQLQALKAPPDEAFRRAALYEQKLAEAAGDPEKLARLERDPKYSMFRQGYDLVKSYQREREGLNAEIEGYRDMTVGKTPIATQEQIPTRGEEKLSPQAQTDMAEAIRQGKATEAHLIELLDSGEITAADFAKVRSIYKGGGAAQVTPKGKRRF